MFIDLSSLLIVSSKLELGYFSTKVIGEAPFGEGDNAPPDIVGK
jgi:hypothetical protein